MTKAHAPYQDTLWEYLTDAAKEDGTIPDALTVKDIMDTWTLQKGFPVIKVTRDYTEGNAAFSQSQFNIGPLFSNFSSNRKKVDKEPSLYWWVPLTMGFAKAGDSNALNNMTVSHWLDPAEADRELVIQLTTEDPAAIAHMPLVVNLQQNGYYRANYDEQNWALIADFLSVPDQLTDIHRTIRAQAIPFNTFIFTVIGSAGYWY
jgi:aminopeptidase N